LGASTRRRVICGLITAKLKKLSYRYVKDASVIGAVRKKGNKPALSGLAFK
jgi:hypothetical protein